MINEALEEDKAKESMLRLAYNHVERIREASYIVGDNGKYGVVTLRQGVIIPCLYSKIINTEYYFRVYREKATKVKAWGVPVYDVENGLFSLEGNEVIPFGNYMQDYRVKNFGVALFNTNTGSVALATSSGKVRTDLKGNKLISIGISGYAALIEKHSDEKNVRLLLDTDLNIHKNLNHLYDKVERLGNHAHIATKGTKYTYVDECGVPTALDWYNV